MIIQSHTSKAVKDIMPTGTKVTYDSKDRVLSIQTNTQHLIKVLTILKTKLHYKMFVDIFAVDYLDRKARFEVIYSLLNMRHNIRALVKLQVDEYDEVPSVEKLFSAAIWYEREIWDMYGVIFTDNSDLRRILTDYGFEGHPQRKDFPLTGYVEVRYDAQQQKVIYEPVKLEQEYRNFDFISPWEGTQCKIPQTGNTEKESK